MKTYRVHAVMYTDLYTDVEANSEDEAYEIAKDRAANGELEEDESMFSGGLDITSVVEVER